MRADLVEEAIRLAQLLTSHEMTALPQSHALLSLMLLQGSRLPARVDRKGRLVLLADQDRSLWDPHFIAAGFRHLSLASAGAHLSEFHVQAAIAACHIAATRAEDTDWAQILAHYDTLVEHAPSPVAYLNRVVAVAKVHGAAAGLDALDAIETAALDDYALLPATRGELLQQIGRHDDAAEAFARARDLARTEPERRFLEARIRHLTD